MWRSKWLLCFWIVFIISVGNNTLFGLLKIDEMRVKLWSLEAQLQMDLFGAAFRSADERQKDTWLINSFKNFSNELKENFPTNGSEYLTSLELIPAWNQTQEECRKLDEFYQNFYTILQGFGTLEMSQNMHDNIVEILKKFALQHVAGMHHMIINTFEQIENNIDLYNLYKIIYEDISARVCRDYQSLQQILYNLYTTVTLAEIKAYAMIQFSFNLLRIYNPGANFTKELEAMREYYRSRSIKTLRAVKVSMHFAPKDVWRCDPETPRLDETYTKLTLFQGYLVNEVDLNEGGTCRESCGYYEYTKLHGCYQNLFCAQQRKCNGRLIKCDYTHSSMHVCLSPKDSERRYEFIEYENGRIFGRKQSCITTKVDSWWRWIFWHCSYCFCYCDDETAYSDRYFSLRSTVTNEEDDKIVIGARLIKRKQVIHIQIQEGELMAGGIVRKQDQPQWKPIEKFSILDSHIHSGIDYHTLSWEKKGIDLDDLSGAKDHILTGLRFRVLGSRLNLEIRVCQFNFTTGKLVRPTENCYWMGNDQTRRRELKLINPDIPTNTKLLSPLRMTRDQYVNFAPSSRESDVAQNTIPFIDIQPVTPFPSIPLGGAGIFYKGRRNSGGYVGLKLLTYDMTQHLVLNITADVESIFAPPQQIQIV